MDPKSNTTGVHIRGEDTVTHVGKRPGGDRGRDCSDTSICQGMSSTASNHQKLGKGKESFFPRAFSRSMAYSDFWPPEQWENPFVVLSPPVCGKLLQQP